MQVFRVKLDSYLSFHENVEYVQSKTLPRIGLPGRARQFMNHEASVPLYNILAAQYLSTVLFFDATGQRDKNIVQKVTHLTNRSTNYHQIHTRRSKIR